MMQVESNNPKQTLTCPCFFTTEREACALWMRTADERGLSGTVHRQHAALLVVRRPASVFHICNTPHSFQDSIICTKRKNASKLFQDALNTVATPICKILPCSETLREKSPLTVEVTESHVTKCVRAHVRTTKGSGGFAKISK